MRLIKLTSMICPVPIHAAIRLDTATGRVQIIKCVNRIIWKTLLDANSLLLTLGVYYWWDCYIPLAMLHTSRSVHPDKCPSFISLVSSQSHGQTCKTSLNVLPHPPLGVSPCYHHCLYSEGTSSGDNIFRDLWPKPYFPFEWSDLWIFTSMFNV